MFNLIKQSINLFFLFLYRSAIFLGILLIIYLLLPSSLVSTLDLFNYLPQFLLNFHTSTDTLSVTAKDVQEIRETVSLLSNILVVQDATILELNAQIKTNIQAVGNLKEELLLVKGDYKQTLENIKISIQEIKINPKIDITQLELILNNKLNEQTDTITSVFSKKINDFTSLQLIQLEQIKLSHKSLKEVHVLHNTALIEIKNSIVAGNQSFIDTLSLQTQNLLANLSTSNIYTSINNQTTLLNQLIASQKNTLSIIDFTKSIDAIKENFTNLNLEENEKRLESISNTLNRLNITKINNLEDKVNNIQKVVDNLNSVKVVKTEVQGKSQQTILDSIWNWNKK